MRIPSFLSSVTRALFNPGIQHKDQHRQKSNHDRRYKISICNCQAFASPVPQHLTQMLSSTEGHDALVYCGFFKSKEELTEALDKPPPKNEEKQKKVTHAEFAAQAEHSTPCNTLAEYLLRERWQKHLGRLEALTLGFEKADGLDSDDRLPNRFGVAFPEVCDEDLEKLRENRFLVLDAKENRDFEHKKLLEELEDLHSKGLFKPSTNACNPHAEGRNNFQIFIQIKSKTSKFSSYDCFVHSICFCFKGFGCRYRRMVVLKRKYGRVVLRS